MKVTGLDCLDSLKRRQRRIGRPCVVSPQRQSLCLRQTMEECAICCQEMDDSCLATTDCKHTFHTACLCRASRYNGTCPLCRAPLWVDSYGDESQVKRLSTRLDRLTLTDHPEFQRVTAFVMPRLSRRLAIMLQPNEPDVTAASSDVEIGEVATVVASSAIAVSLTEVARGE